MSNLHSVLDPLVLIGIAYGWRIDAIALGGLMWIMAAGYAHLRMAVA